MKLKKGDKVIVIAGRDRNREGVIERVYEKRNSVVIPQINQFKKHIKKSEQTPEGGIIDVPRPIGVSKLALICPKCNKRTRVGYKVTEKSKQRICKQCESVI